MWLRAGACRSGPPCREARLSLLARASRGALSRGGHPSPLAEGRSDTAESTMLRRGGVPHGWARVAVDTHLPLPCRALGHGGCPAWPQWSHSWGPCPHRQPFSQLRSETQTQRGRGGGGVVKEATKAHPGRSPGGDFQVGPQSTQPGLWGLPDSEGPAEVPTGQEPSWPAPTNEPRELCTLTATLSSLATCLPVSLRPTRSLGSRVLLGARAPGRTHPLSRVPLAGLGRDGVRPHHGQPLRVPVTEQSHTLASARPVLAQRPPGAGSGLGELSLWAPLGQVGAGRGWAPPGREGTELPLSPGAQERGTRSGLDKRTSVPVTLWGSGRASLGFSRAFKGIPARHHPSTPRGGEETHPRAGARAARPPSAAER